MGESVLFNDNSPWVKKEGEEFDVTMGSFDGAETTDLVGLFLLHQLQHLPVEAEVNREVLKLVEEEESDEISSLSSIEAAHRHVELLPLPLDPGAVLVEEDGLLAG